jgi:hypothetical protein
LASSPSSQIQALRVIVKWTLQLGREKELGLRRTAFIPAAAASSLQFPSEFHEKILN